MLRHGKATAAAIRLCARPRKERDDGAVTDARATTLRSFFEAGRAEDALEDLRLAAKEGSLDTTAWLLVAAVLYARGAEPEAWLVVEEALVRLPPSAELCVVAALLRLEHGLVIDAEEAVAKARALDASLPATPLAAALVCARQGDPAGARERLYEASRRRVPRAIVRSFAVVCGIDGVKG